MMVRLLAKCTTPTRLASTCLLLGVAALLQAQDPPADPVDPNIEVIKEGTGCQADSSPLLGVEVPPEESLGPQTGPVRDYWKKGAEKCGKKKRLLKPTPAPASSSLVIPYPFTSPKPFPSKLINAFRVMRAVNESVVECTGICQSERRRLQQELGLIQAEIDRELTMMNKEKEHKEAKQHVAKCAEVLPALNQSVADVKKKLRSGIQSELANHKNAQEKQEVIKNQAKMLKDMYEKEVEMQATLHTLKTTGNDNRHIAMGLTEIKQQLAIIKKNIRPPVLKPITATNNSAVTTLPTQMNEMNTVKNWDAQDNADGDKTAFGDPPKASLDDKTIITDDMTEHKLEVDENEKTTAANTSWLDSQLSEAVGSRW